MPTGVDTDLATGREIREFEGKRHVLEYAIHVDYALLRGYRADHLGNVQFRGGSQNFNPSFAKAARVAIVEVDEIVEPGEIAPELIDLPGIFVSRVVTTTHVVDGKAWRRPARRPADQPRLYDGKPALTREGIARNAAKLVKEGTYVNLGVASPDGVELSRGSRVILHAEEWRPRLRPDGLGRERDRSGHLQRRRPVRRAEPRRVVLRQRRLIRDGARRQIDTVIPGLTKSTSTVASRTGVRLTPSAAVSAARWTCSQAKAI